MENWDRKRVVDWLGRLWPLLFLGAITLFFIYPVSLHPSQLVIGRPVDDAFENIWYLEWYKDALLNLNSSPLFQPDIFYPDGWSLGLTTLPPFFPALMAPVTALLGSVTTYNLMIIASMVGAAFGVYLLVRAVGGSALGGIFAGTAYAFYPNRQVYLGGFLNLLLASMCLPWMVLALYQAVNEPHKRSRWLVLAVLAYTLSIAAAWQYIYIATFTLAIFGLLYVLPAVWRDWRAWVRPLVLAALLFLFTTAPLLLAGLYYRQRLGSTVAFPLDDLVHSSVSIERFLVPSALNPLFMRVAREIFPLRNGEDGVVAFGFAVIVLAVVGLIYAKIGRVTKVAFAGLAIIGILFMMGPFLQLHGEPVTSSAAWLRNLDTLIPEMTVEPGQYKLPMPALLIYKLVPPLQAFHHFGRLGVVVTLCLGVLASLGLTIIQNRCSRRTGMIIGLVALLLLLIEVNPQPQSWITAMDGMQRDVDIWLQEQDEQKVIMEYPIWYSFSAQSLYYALAHEQKMVHGYSIISPRFLETREILKQWPSDEAIDLLDEFGVDYVLMHIQEGYDDYERDRLPAVLDSGRVALIGYFPRTAEAQELPSYWNGRIQPMTDMMQGTYVFELLDGAP